MSTQIPANVVPPAPAPEWDATFYERHLISVKLALHAPDAEAAESRALSVLYHAYNYDIEGATARAVDYFDKWMVTVRLRRIHATS